MEKAAKAHLLKMLGKSVGTEIAYLAVMIEKRDDPADDYAWRAWDTAHRIRYYGTPEVMLEAVDWGWIYTRYGAVEPMPQWLRITLARIATSILLLEEELGRTLI